jgi:hypothetical protein
MKKTSILIFVLLLSATYSVFGQLAVGYGTDGNTLSLSTNPSNKFWGEFSVNTKSYNQASWSYNDKGITQAYLLVNLFTSEKVSLYSGAGAGINLLSKESEKWVSVNVPVGLKVNPFASFPNLFLTGEYNPMIITADGIPVIHCVSLGFKYVLSKKE